MLLTPIDLGQAEDSIMLQGLPVVGAAAAGSGFSDCPSLPNSCGGKPPAEPSPRPERGAARAPLLLETTAMSASGHCRHSGENEQRPLGLPRRRARACEHRCWISEQCQADFRSDARCADASSAVSKMCGAIARCLSASPSLARRKLLVV